MRRTLYELGTDAEALDALLEEMQGDVSDEEVSAAIDEWLRENTDALESKIDGYCALIREYLARADARRREAQRMRALIDSDENKAQRMKERLLRFLEDQGIDKMETARFRVVAQNNGGPIPLVLHHELDPKTLLSRFQDVQVTADETAIREALDAGEFLSFACYGERGRHLRIK